MTEALRTQILANLQNLPALMDLLPPHILSFTVLSCSTRWKSPIKRCCHR